MMFRPGTVLLIIFIAGFGFFVYNWATGSIDSTGDKALDEQKKAIECSQLTADFLRFGEEGNSTRITFQLTQDVETAEVDFRGERNSSIRLENLSKDSIHTAEANGTGYSDVYITTDGCGKTFSYR
jgi:hypothetical protein